MASTPFSKEARRAIRRRTDAPSTLRGSSTGPLDTFVQDISATGAKIECSAELALGDSVSIGLAGVGQVRAMVVWKRDGQYGLDFVVPLTAADAERAFAGGTVISLGAPPAPARTETEADAEEDGDDGVYAEASGVLSALLFVVAGVTALAVAWLQSWI